MKRLRIEVRGIVQGVGFRPFVYNLAVNLGLSGWVRNHSHGVSIEVEGARTDRFVSELREHPPELAQIDEVDLREIAVENNGGFRILESAEEDSPFALVPPDIATCADCYADFTSAANRRYRYPFTNCTNCGPRYTIIQDVPYDRPLTTMSAFPMCEACRAEYSDPADRRFHAQPNACPICGPWVELWRKGELLAARDPAIREAQRLLAEGAIVAIKGLGGFHLACLASASACDRLRERKRRSDKPFALMARDVEVVKRHCEVPGEASRVLRGPRRPVVILNRLRGGTLPREIAPGNNTLGMMLPYTPLHHLLFDAAPYDLLVMTSGNLSEEPIASRDEEARERLENLADYFLLHNRAIQTRADDSVVRLYAGRERLIRRSRGYAPLPVDLGSPQVEVLAVGGELKNTFCLTHGRYAILSQHIGDLENLETLEFFEETLAHMKRFFRVNPRGVAHDLHPGYLSTRLAQAIPDLPRIGVQHHHAHIASCMADNRVAGRVIGVALDGTGYGTDGAIWGGEVLLCDFAGFERLAHLRYVPLVGGDAAVREPWRMALAYLRDAGLADTASLAGEPRRRVAAAMLERGIRSVPTSSCGRLFDAVASLAGLRDSVSFEGQAAMELEAVSEPGPAYPFEVDDLKAPWQIDLRDMIREIAAGGEAASRIGGRFHATLAAAIVKTCEMARETHGLRRVCLSGGSFQNVLLTALVQQRLQAGGFEVFLHGRVPANDGGIALGQAVIASEALKSGEPGVTAPGAP
ncbi:MAG: carbamoyltransferase HypF [Bryobacteraceae bacterium]|nr:carbamoyltransferase HypF [Bryobacteraceae bacterium]